MHGDGDMADPDTDGRYSHLHLLSLSDSVCLLALATPENALTDPPVCFNRKEGRKEKSRRLVLGVKPRCQKPARSHARGPGRCRAELAPCFASSSDQKGSHIFHSRYPQPQAIPSIDNAT